MFSPSISSTFFNFKPKRGKGGGSWGASGGGNGLEVHMEKEFVCVGRGIVDKSL